MLFLRYIIILNVRYLINLIAKFELNFHSKVMCYDKQATVCPLSAGCIWNHFKDLVSASSIGCYTTSAGLLWARQGCILIIINSQVQIHNHIMEGGQRSLWILCKQSKISNWQNCYLINTGCLHFKALSLTWLHSDPVQSVVIWWKSCQY